MHLKQSGPTGVWLDPRRERRWSDSWWFRLWGWASGVWADCRVWRCAFAWRRVGAVFRYSHLTRGGRKSADIKGSIADPTSASFAVPQRGKLVWWRGR